MLLLQIDIPCRQIRLRMGSSGSRPHVSDADLAKTTRKCSSYAKGLEACRKANAADADRICKNLAVTLVTCYAEEHAQDEAVEHRRYLQHFE